MPIEPRDRRGDTRAFCSRQIWWRGGHEGLYNEGWQVDESRNGMAFLTRAVDPPRAGELVHVMNAGADASGPVTRGVIRRVQPIQSGVRLIAVELFAHENVVTLVNHATTRAAA